MKHPTRAARRLSLGMAAVVFTALCTRELCSSDQVDQQTARMVAQMIPAFHLSQHAIDDSISEGKALITSLRAFWDPAEMRPA